jgi:hypothetical protein
MEENNNNPNETTEETMSTEFFTNRTDRDARFNHFLQMGFTLTGPNTLFAQSDSGDPIWVSRTSVPPCGKYPMGAYAVRFP